MASATSRTCWIWAIWFALIYKASSVPRHHSDVLSTDHMPEKSCDDTLSESVTFEQIVNIPVHIQKYCSTEYKKPEQEHHICSATNISTDDPPQREQKDQQQSAMHTGIDKEKCITKFKTQYNKEKALITWIKANKIKILNSGIKAA